MASLATHSAGCSFANRSTYYCDSLVCRAHYHRSVLRCVNLQNIAVATTMDSQDNVGSPGNGTFPGSSSSHGRGRLRRAPSLARKAAPAGATPLETLVESCSLEDKMSSAETSEQQNLLFGREATAATPARNPALQLASRRSLAGNCGMLCGPGERFRALHVIGSGGNGTVYRGIHVASQHDIAIKVQDIRSRGCMSAEAESFQLLQGIPGIPRLHWTGISGKNHIIVTDLMGPSLQDLAGYFEATAPNHPHLPEQTVALIAVQLVERLGMLHCKAKLVHRDIKPGNLLMGPRSVKETVYLVDFGMSRSFLDADTRNHVEDVLAPRMHRTGVPGTLSYASTNVQLGHTSSRRDDMIALGYTLVFLGTGSLPWQSVTGATKAARIDKVLEWKQRTSSEELCAGLPHEYVVYMEMCARLAFSEKPSYEKMQGLFVALCKHNRYIPSCIWQWETPGVTKPYSLGQAVRHGQLQPPSSEDLDGELDYVLAGNEARSCGALER